MLKIRTKRRATDTGLALARLPVLASSMTALGDEDSLDICVAGDPTSLREMAGGAMLRRDLSL